MVHLSTEALSEVLDGERVAGAEKHLASCAVCRGDLEALREMRASLRDLPELEPPPELWSRIETRLPAGGSLRSRLGSPGRVMLQVVAMAAVFVLGLGLGSLFEPGGPASRGEGPQVAAVEETGATNLSDALAQVRRLSLQYDAALNNLDRLARQEGRPMPSVTRERLAGLDALVEASRTALAAEPADPVLNSYLFAALEERDAMVRQMRAESGASDEVLWR